MPVYRLTASSMISSFRVSGKRHLLLTGGRGTGKSTLLRALVPLLCPGAQEITTAAYPADRVEIRESVGGKIAVIGRFDPALPPGENRMRPVADGFLLLGVPALHRMAAGESEWAVLDELGYLENSCPEFRQAVEALLDAKRVLAVVRKQDTPFLTALCARQDAFVVDLDDPAPALGCVVMRPAGAAVRRKQADGGFLRCTADRQCAGSSHPAAAGLPHCRDPLGRG